MGAARRKVLGVALFVCCLWVLQSYLGALEFDRQQILAGEIWRLWTGHLVHSNSSHFSLNIAAALVIYFAFFTGVNLSEIFSYGFLFSALISLMLLCVYPNLDWYNGLSGLLHSLVAYFSIRLARGGDKIYWVGLVIVWLKVLLEVRWAYLGYENLISNITVITEAHLIGTFIGSVAAFIYMPHWLGKVKSEYRKVNV